MSLTRSCYSWLPSKCTRLCVAAAWSMVTSFPLAQSMPMGPDTARVRLERVWCNYWRQRDTSDSCQGGYYGYDSSIDPDHVLEHGLPARGDDWDLITHARAGGLQRLSRHDEARHVPQRRRRGGMGR